MIAEQIKELLPQHLQNITYIGDLPTDVDACVALMEIGGPHGTYFAGDQIDTPHLKVLIRNPSFTAGYTVAAQCKNILTSHSDLQNLSVILIGDIMYMGRDDKRRNVWQLTYKIYSYIGR